MQRDAFGNALSLGDPSSLAGVDAFVAGFLACEARVVDVLGAAVHDDAPIVQGCAAALHLFAETPGAAANARRHLDRADASRVPATDRERGFVAAVRAWADGDIARAVALHEAQAAAHPRDLASVKLGQYHCFNLGDAPRMLRLALAAAPAAADVAPMHGMLAFGYEQCHLLRRAEAAARRAVAMRRREPWAHHALAHVMLTEDRLDEGEAFLRSVADTWTGLNSFMVTHNWWHLALFLVEGERLDEALALHDARVWGVCPDYSQDQVNAVSLLARIELAGGDVGSRWQALAPWLVPRAHDHVQPFLDLHYLYGLARADRPEAQTLLASLEAHGHRAPAALREAWLRVAVPAGRGLLAHARGDAEGAVQGLGEALPRLVEIGGSHAQRDLFEQVFVDALMASGRWTAAHHLLQPAANARPASRRIASRLRRTYGALGLGGAIDA
ncbi:MAG: tetratricopeptide repeat protein [Burkholderiales bacterium]|nr:MAG: tetratricopeptide repeat protein [Burkholderiales bacterium]